MILAIQMKRHFCGREGALPASMRFLRPLSARSKRYRRGRKTKATCPTVPVFRRQVIPLSRGGLRLDGVAT